MKRCQTKRSEEMIRPDPRDYTSRQPGLPDLQRYAEYVKDLEEYCNRLEFFGAIIKLGEKKANLQEEENKA
jgi:hypothetical protein